MADFVFNVSKGRVVEMYKRVDENDPANSALLVIAINSSATDTTLKRLDTIALLLADGNTAEVTNTNYARKTLTDADLTAFAPDDVNDRAEVDIPDQTWTAVSAGTAWTDLVIAYNPDTTASPQADSDFEPLTQHDFAATPDGSDITAEIDANGFFRAS